ncbi:MAG: hypothetical protein ACUVXD_17645 [Thermodesulfobacteriota bacterium]
MNALTLFCLGLVMVAFQTTLFRALAISYIKAPLILPLVMYAAFRMEAIRGLVLSFALGYAMDVFSGGVKGLTSVFTVLLCLGGHWLRKGIFVDGVLAQALVGFSFGVAYGLLWMGAEALVEGGGGWGHFSPTPRILLQSLVLAIVSPVLMRIAAPIDRISSKGWRRLQGSSG